MTGEAWRQYLQTYVALRRAIGFAMRPEAHLLQDFVDHLERRGHDAPVAQVAVEWATASAGQHAHRLSIVRGFLTMVRAAEPDPSPCNAAGCAAGPPLSPGPPRGRARTPLQPTRTATFKHATGRPDGLIFLRHSGLVLVRP